MKDQIQTSTDSLADLCLAQEEYQAYTDRDLFNSSLIFLHVLTDVMWRTNFDLSKEKKELLAKTTGKALRELIKASTGKDIHEVAKSLK